MSRKPDNSIKEEILEKVLSVLAKDGLNNLSLRDIAREVDVSARMLIYHFESYEALINSVFIHLSIKHKSILKMSDIKKNIALLFENPLEPIFLQKGPNRAVFDVPDNFLTDRYQLIGADLQNRFGESSMQRIPVKNISVPDLRIPMTLGRQDPFSLFIPKHRKIAARLIDIFMGNYQI